MIVVLPRTFEWQGYYAVLLHENEKPRLVRLFTTSYCKKKIPKTPVFTEVPIFKEYRFVRANSVKVKTRSLAFTSPPKIKSYLQRFIERKHIGAKFIFYLTDRELACSTVVREVRDIEGVVDLEHNTCIVLAREIVLDLDRAQLFARMLTA
ncbi:MAG: hypothetical protein DRJ40_08285 [Thermoprotei archaeon]|nr:MAG: hypothetical protein DRJ40_08285 [Thermoprotei archaeon]